MRRLLIDLAGTSAATLISRSVPARRGARHVTSGAFRSSASLMKSVCAPPMSSCVMKFAVRSGVGWFGSVVGNSLPTSASDRIWPRRVSRSSSNSAPRRAPCCPREVAGVRRVFGDLPASDQADAVRMQQAAESFAVRSPAQIGARIERALRARDEAAAPHRDQAAEDRRERDLVTGSGGSPARAPHLLIRVGEQRVDDVLEARAGVRAIFVGDRKRLDVEWGGSRPGLYACAGVVQAELLDPGAETLGVPGARIHHGSGGIHE